MISFLEQSSWHKAIAEETFLALLQLLLCPLSQLGGILPSPQVCVLTSVEYAIEGNGPVGLSGLFLWVQDG